MSDATKVVPIELAGETYRLSYTQRSWYRVERETGRVLGDLFKDLEKGSFSAMVDLVWAGIIHDKPDLKPEDVADLVQFDDAERVAKAVNEAMADVLPESDDPTEPQPDAE